MLGFCDRDGMSAILVGRETGTVLVFCFCCLSAAGGCARMLFVCLAHETHETVCPG